MPSLSDIIGHWGYAAIFVVVILGNVGLPVPEETIIGLSGYLVWRGELSFPWVILVGILSAVAGDNLGYWAGRIYGSKLVEGYAGRLVSRERLVSVERFIDRYGGWGVFLARFLPVARFAAGPLSGAAGLSFARFFLANMLGASCYVPLVVLAGYAVGLGLGPQLERLRFFFGGVEHLVLAAALVAAIWELSRRLRLHKKTLQ